MTRASLVAVLALLVSGASAIACMAPDPGRDGPGLANGPRGKGKTAANDDDDEPLTPEQGSTSDDPGSNPGSNPPPSGSADAGDAAAPPSPDAGEPPPPPDPDPVPAGSYAVGTQLKTTADLNLREGEGTEFAVVTTMPEGSIVTVAAISGATGWVNVTYDGSTGFCSKSYLTEP